MNLSKMKVYKGVLVAKGSELSEAMDDKDPEKAKKVYEATTERFNKMYSEEDRRWFWNVHKNGTVA